MSRRPLLLIGAGGLAREVLAAVRAGNDWTPLGALDDDPNRHGTEIDGLPVLGSTDLVHEHTDAAVIVCVANALRPRSRATVVQRLGLPDDRYGTVVHPAASLAAGTEVGHGGILLAGVVVTAPQRIGSHLVAMPHVVLTHDDGVGDFVTLAGRATLAGGVHIGQCAYLGQGSMIRENTKIGEGAVIGMGAVVLSDVPAGETWAGVPAGPLGASR
jgi:sugar O-acyltransferase (sialic acid O-acetyltransferase NeuD family)